MMNIKQKIKAKLRSSTGETIGETLVALLISALALVMLAGAVTSAVNVITRSKAVMDGYYKLNNAVAARATTAPNEDGLTVNTTSGSFTGQLKVSIPGIQPSTADIEVNYWKNEQLSGTQVIAYSRKQEE